MDGCVDRKCTGRFQTLFDMIESRSSSSAEAVSWGPVIGADEETRGSHAVEVTSWGPVIGADEEVRGSHRPETGWWGPVIGADEGSADGFNEPFTLIDCLIQDESSAPSDRRFKHDIQDAGTTVYGLPLYHYRYHGREGVYEGVMADDVLRVKPSAVSRDEKGFLFVNYRSLGLELRRIA